MQRLRKLNLEELKEFLRGSGVRNYKIVRIGASGTIHLDMAGKTGEPICRVKGDLDPVMIKCYLETPDE